VGSGEEDRNLEAVVGGGVAVADRGGERLGDRVHQRRRRELGTAVPDEERRGPGRVLQPGLVDVQVEPVDALDLQHHMVEPR
jgi:hypothetical protein